MKIVRYLWFSHTTVCQNLQFSDGWLSMPFSRYVLCKYCDCIGKSVHQQFLSDIVLKNKASRAVFQNLHHRRGSAHAMYSIGMQPSLVVLQNALWTYAHRVLCCLYALYSILKQQTIQQHQEWLSWLQLQWAFKWWLSLMLLQNATASAYAKEFSAFPSGSHDFAWLKWNYRKWTV